MTPKQIHALVHDRSTCSVARLGPKTVSSDLEPLVLLEIESVKVVSVMAVIPAENVQLIVVNNR